MNQGYLRDLDEKVFDLESRLEAKNQEIRDLASIGSVITAILDIESVLAVAMEIAIRQVAGEVGAVLQAEEGDLRVKISWGLDGSVVQALTYRDDMDIARYCMHHKQTVMENDCGDTFTAGGAVKNILAAPILAKEKPIGAVIIINKIGGGPFSDRDRSTLEMICKFTSIAIENSNLVKESLEKQKMEQELELARQVQATLLPEEVSLTGLKVASSYIPARQVGGDYYDLIPVSDNGLFVLIGDVTNKGAPAALVMTAVYSIVRAYVKGGRKICVTDIICHLNDILCDNIIKGREMFITLFMAYIDLEKGQIEYCNGGHPPPFYYRAADRETVRLKTGGPLVGQFAGLRYHSSRIKIGRGDRMFCYTDGLVEAENRDGGLYGMDRLEQFFSLGVILDTDRFSRVVRDEIARFSQGGRAEAVDDYTTLVIDMADDAASGRTYRLSYPSRLDILGDMYGDLDDIFSRHAVPRDAAEPFRVAVSEAVTNAIVHAHDRDDSKKIRLSIDVNDNRICADIIDEGHAGKNGVSLNFNMNRDPMGEGGRGLGLIKRLSDDVTLEYLSEGGLNVKISKNLK